MSTPILYNIDELQSRLEECDLIGSKIEAIDIIGKLAYTDHSSMITCYYNTIPEGEKIVRRHHVYEDEIPLDMQRSRTLSSHNPYVITLDGGLVCEIGFQGASRATVELKDTNNHRPNRFVNASKILAPVIGETITGIRVVPMRENEQERHYIVKGKSKHPFRTVEIICESVILYMNWINAVLLDINDRNSPLQMTMGEWKSCISYYSDLFDKR